MIVSDAIIQQSPRFFTLLERFHCITREGRDVTMNAGTMIASSALVLTLLGSVYGLVIVPLQQDIHELEVKQAEQHLDHEIRIRAGEISDGRTGVHLERLTKSIDRLIDKIEVGR